MATTLDVVDAKGKKTGSVDLPGAIFDVQTNVPLIHQVVTAQLAAARQGTHKTKGRGEVSGSGTQAVQAEGHRPRPSGLDPRAAAPRRWHRSRAESRATTPSAPPRR